MNTIPRHRRAAARRWLPISAAPLLLLSLFLCAPRSAVAGTAPQPMSATRPLAPGAALTGTIPVGFGSYTDQLPPGRQGPITFACTKPDGTVVEPARPAVPAVVPGFAGPVQTHDWWSSLIWRANNPYVVDKGCQLARYGQNLHPHPWGLVFRSLAPGSADPGQMWLGYTSHYVIPDEMYQDTYRTYQHDLFQDFSLQLKDAGGSYLYAEDTKVQRYSDWDVTAFSDDGSGHTWKTTIVEGSPFLYLQTTNVERIELRVAGVSTKRPTTQQPLPNVLGFTQSFEMPSNTGMTPNPALHHFGFFASEDAVANNDSGDWRVFSIRNLPANGYVAIAILPDDKAETLEYFRRRAYALPTATDVGWHYDPSSAQVTSIFSVTTTLVQTGTGLLNQTVQGLYRHQWRNLSAPSSAALTPYAYSSVMGEMKLLDGNVFSTTMVFDGILNVLPNKQADNTNFMQQLIVYLDAAPTGTPNADTYFNGKEMARLAELARVANAAGQPALRDKFLAALRPVMEDWLTYSGPDDKKLFYYDPTWNTLIGYEPSYGSDTLLNDHHFHYGYFLSAAAALADFTPHWGDADQWGGMVDLLIKDVANGDRGDTRFPFLRFFDPMAGHSWANGAANAADGNNQESSSEAVNFAAGLILWGSVTGDDAVRDLGIFLYTNETAATHQYWFDIDDAVRQRGPSANGRVTPWKTNGIVWGSKGSAVTYFGASAACIVGINLLPFTGGSLYLAQDQRHVQAVYDQVAKAYDAFRCWAPGAGTGTPPPPAGADDWSPFFWQYRSFADPAAAAAMFTDTVPYLNDLSSGTSPAQVYYWLQNMAALGTRVTSITADNPLHAVFARHDGLGKVTLTYVVNSHDDAPRVVTFSDGTQVAAAPNSFAVATRELRNPLYFPRVARE